ncbi:MAG: IPT/TIG domain-containing protein, partial [Solirubrobacteraceae bacterium]
MAIVLCACGLFATRAQAAQVISYPSFSGATGLQLNSAASIVGSSLQLTPAQLQQSGTAFSRTEIQPSGSFETEFELRMHESNTLESFGDPADGIAFVLQPLSAAQVGLPGGDLGYAGVTPSAVVQFDIYQNSYDPSVPYISFMENGNAEEHLAESATPLTFPLYGETPVRAWVLYNAAQTELSVYAAQAPASKPATALFTYKVNLAELLKSEYAFAGFTAGTGAGDAVQEVLNWQLSSDSPTQTVTPPTVTKIEGETGSTNGGTEVTIKGSHFLAPATVTIGGESVSGEVVSAEEIKAKTPSGNPGPAEVVVTDPGGRSEGGPTFTYVSPPSVESINPSSGSFEGGTPVTITGSGFISGMTVTIGGQKLTKVEVQGPTELTAVTPPGSPGSGEVLATDFYGMSLFGPTYTYVVPTPTITELEPSSGSVKGGNEVSIVGTGFTAGSTVTFGSNPAAGVTVNSANSITANAPAGSLGTVNVSVTTSGGVTEETSADRYSYVPAGQISGLDIDSYCKGLGYEGSGGGPAAILTKGAVTGTNFAYENWACQKGDGSTTLIANTGPAPSFEDACAVANPGHTTYAYAGDANSAFSWDCYQVPHVASIEPSSGPASGETAVTIKGAGFVEPATVTIGGRPASEVEVRSEGEITAKTPAGEGEGEVAVEDEDGTSSGGPKYTYLPPPCAESPAIEEQPSSQTVTAPASASFKATASTPVNCAAPS